MAKYRAKNKCLFLGRHVQKGDIVEVEGELKDNVFELFEEEKPEKAKVKKKGK